MFGLKAKKDTRPADRFGLNGRLADLRLMSQESFHEGWVAALASLLEGAAQKHRAKWRPSPVNSCDVISFAAQHAASAATDNFQKGVIDHHWQTRFYQQLSAVCLDRNDQRCVAPTGPTNSFEDGRG